MIKSFFIIFFFYNNIFLNIVIELNFIVTIVDNSKPTFNERKRVSADTKFNFGRIQVRFTFYIVLFIAFVRTLHYEKTSVFNSASGVQYIPTTRSYPKAIQKTVNYLKAIHQRVPNMITQIPTKDTNYKYVEQTNKLNLNRQILVFFY